MKKSLSIMVILALVYSIIALLAVGCAKETPTSVPETYNVTPAITVLTPALAWWDMSDSLFCLHVDKAEYGNVVADTASLWVTAYDAGVAYSTEYFGYRSGIWSWVASDPTCIYQPADSVKLELTYWIGAGPKSTVDLWTIVRTGAK